MTGDMLSTYLNTFLPDKNADLLVHSSLSSFGYIQGGADAVIDSICDVCNGNIVMPTLSFSFVDEAAPVFDARTTPSTTGKITEEFRKRKNVLRSSHIFSSAAVLGPNAEEYTSNHLDTPCGTGSPWRTLVERRGYVLFLGATFASNTIFHCSEEESAPEYLSYFTVKNAQVTDIHGNSFVHTYRRYNCSQTGVIRHLGKMEAIYRECGLISDVMIGSCHAMLIPAFDNFETGCRVLRENPDFILEP